MRSECNTPLISVIVPVYQVERYLRECLDSVLAQTYVNLEIIVVDDGSTDSSPRIVSEYASKDARIRRFTQPNQGLSSARNTGLEHASGEYILFVDSDDVLSPDHVKVLYRALVESGADVSVTNLTSFTDSFLPGDWCGDVKTISSEEAVKIIFYQGEFDTCAPGKLYKAHLWKGVRFPVGYIHEDLPTVYRTLLNGKTVAFFGSGTYGYRKRADGLNHSRTDERKANTLALINEVVERIDESCPALSRAVRCFRASFCFHLILNADKGSISDETKRSIEQTLKQDRSVVIMDGNARRKTRIACLLSYCGFGVVSTVFRMAARAC